MSLHLSDSTISIISGACAGAIEATVSYPFEFLKTRKQIEPVPYRFMIPDIYRRFGIRGFYMGSSILIIGSIPKASMRFTINGFCLSVAPDNLLGKMLSAMVAGFITSLCVIAPMESLKTAAIDLSRSGSAPFSKTYQAMASHKGGFVRGLYAGSSPTILKNISNTTIRFTMQPYFVDGICYLTNTKSNWGVNAFSGAVVAWISVILTQPIDYVKTKLQTPSARVNNTGLVNLIMRSYREVGMKGFYSGTVSRLIRVTPENALLFGVYSYVSTKLKSINNQF